MDLFSTHPPSPLQFKSYLSHFSTHRQEPSYTITRSGEGYGRPLPRTRTCADHLAPGHYPVERDVVLGHSFEEFPAGRATTCARARSAFMPLEDRENAYLRIFSVSKSPGPVQYDVRSDAATPAWTMPQHLKDAPRPIPREVTAADHLGPGLYRVNNHFDRLGWRKSEQTERAALRLRETWASRQYSHIFGRLKPGPKPNLTKVASAPIFR
mmetsp:Transcript_44049/g.101786  ORF Transcript_44049/g.101786 Transcript_44049/m.101786 type:complete len:211 (+) Transcript_44049:79-711(+)